jgi:O-6-methylguanine DNA methyltransferase
MANKATKVTPFQESVYTLLKQIPEGKVTTYAAIARALDSSPRAVGGALRVNPFAPEVPCHRCIASTGVSHQYFFVPFCLYHSVTKACDMVLTLLSISAASKAIGRMPQAVRINNRN